MLYIVPTKGGHVGVMLVPTKGGHVGDNFVLL